MATADVDGERRAALLEREQIGRLDPAEQPDALVEALALAHVDVGPLVHPVDAREPGERVGDGVTPPLGAGGGELDDHERAVAVGDQSRARHPPREKTSRAPFVRASNGDRLAAEAVIR